jgi:3',5'-cyclic AMP phosphodiesterase CpdA
MKRTFTRSALTLAALVGTALLAQLPNGKDSFRFAVIGDTGTGDRNQYEIGEQLNKFRQTFRFDTVVMMGDNMYGGESPNDFKKKFEIPYAPLLKDGVKFYASLGNHDNSNQRFYEKFNMGGKKYYTFKPRDGIRFFALDSNYMDKDQLEWLAKELAASGSDWKIVFFHHPLYSSGETHGSSEQLRKILEPILLVNNVSVVLSGHEHFYERIKPQQGIAYFILGNSAKLRRGDIQKTGLTAKGFDTDNAFMLCEIDKDKMYFQTISRMGETIDSGVVQQRQPTTQQPKAARAGE